MSTPKASSKNFFKGIFGCFDNITMCLFAWCVPCGGVCMQALDAKSVFSEDKSAGMKACLLAWCCCCFGAAYNRTQLRNKYGLEGSYLVDCLLHWFCGVCAVTQEWQHVFNDLNKDPKTTICNMPKGK